MCKGFPLKLLSHLQRLQQDPSPTGIRFERMVAAVAHKTTMGDSMETTYKGQQHPRTEPAGSKKFVSSGDLHREEDYRFMCSNSSVMVSTRGRTSTRLGTC